ncbi:MAG: four helix bundle protein [Fimbriimonas sp.]
MWKGGFDLVKSCYDLTADFPPDERFGLTSQIRRACTSIPTNIAEGWGRQGSGEFKRFVSIALGSVRELQTLLMLSKELGFGDRQQVEQALLNAESLVPSLTTLYKKLSEDSRG